MTIMIGSIVAMGRSGNGAAVASLIRAREEAIADAAIHRAIAGILDPRPGARWRVDGVGREFIFDGVSVAITVQDEGGKIDINRAEQTVLTALLTKRGGLANLEADALAKRIADWRAPPLSTGEDSQREARQATDGLYRPRRASLQTIDELMLVPGMSRELFSRVAPLVTVYAQRPTVNLQTAPRDVLVILPNVQNADQVLRERANADVQSASGPVRRGVVDPSIPLTGWTIMIRVQFLTQSGAAFSREAVVRITDDQANPYWVMRWGEPSYPF